MRERKYVKFRVDMPEDTKFKIIDMKPERDVIHYIWNRTVLLAGKVNLEGDLYLSKNIPYTIETLAIEFNRDAAQVKLAWEVFIELEMIEITENKIYRVKNFTKHQNIKVKEKEIPNNKKENIKKIDAPLNENLEIETKDDKDKKAGDKTSENSVENVEGINEGSSETSNKDNIVIDDNLKDEKSKYNSQENVPIILETKKSRKKNEKRTDQIIDVIDEKINDDSICCFTDGIKPLADGESTIMEFSFG